MTDRWSRLRQLALLERADLAEYLEQLNPDDWRHRTLCDDWTVQDVLAHLVAWDSLLLHQARRGYVPAMVRWGVAMANSQFRTDRLNRRIIQRSTLDPPHLLNLFRGQLPPDPHWLFDRIAPGAQLAEYVIHHHDIRRPLGPPPPTSAERLRGALDGISHLPGARARARLAQHRWIADDIDWAAGAGPEIHAPAGDLLLLLAGRGLSR